MDVPQKKIPGDVDSLLLDKKGLPNKTQDSRIKKQKSALTFL